MGKIIFFEDRNFQGRTYETSCDCPELTSYLSRCNSCRVESGCFMIYDRPNYTGNQYFLRTGEFSDFQCMGMANSINSCRLIPYHQGSFRMQVYERENFEGQMNELTDDCESVQERHRMSDCQSCNVMDGHWLIYEQPNYRGRMLYLRPGEYRNLREMGMGNVMRFSSMRRIMDSWYHGEILKIKNLIASHTVLWNPLFNLIVSAKHSAAQRESMMRFMELNLIMLPMPISLRFLYSPGFSIWWPMKLGLSYTMKQPLSTLQELHLLRKERGSSSLQIIFYEEKNFQGRSYDCSTDCVDLTIHLSRCGSCRVENGCFVVYDRSNFIGNQNFLRRGEYADVQRMGTMMGMGVLDTIRSCRMIPMHRGQFRIRIYERENFGGQVHELMDDCESLLERYRMTDCQSCNVMEGHWLMFEQPNFRGRMMYVRPGEYRSMRDMGMTTLMKVSSIRRIMDIC
ncbi:very large A-kinase anchor protein-like [Lampris incognitus]|uniref:very large A-kinase anchor protein-like n=1 Tax=Lampris incognitus TaxID=2546036 RepID=UPI0024B4D2E8|nr:very large A-kinase anchor protein-like [Lampris incognitus]